MFHNLDGIILKLSVDLNCRSAESNTFQERYNFRRVEIRTLFVQGISEPKTCQKWHAMACKHGMQVEMCFEQIDFIPNFRVERFSSSIVKLETFHRLILT